MFVVDIDVFEWECMGEVDREKWRRAIGLRMEAVAARELGGRDIVSAEFEEFDTLRNIDEDLEPVLIDGEVMEPEEVHRFRYRIKV